MNAAITLLRPKQWIKSLFVPIGWVYGHGWTDQQVTLSVIMATVAFALSASAVYVFNDWQDRESDRQHPTKRNRPIASGLISSSQAIIIGMVVVGAALLSAGFAGYEVIGFVLGYLLINFFYSLGLKNVPILDVFIIASGFMLRLLAGTIGIGIQPSNWLLLCGLMITLFLGFAKRRAEMAMSTKDRLSPQREVLAKYDVVALDSFLSITLTATLITYGLYCVDPATVNRHGSTNLLWSLPFVAYALFRYLLLLHVNSDGEDPIGAIFFDRHIIAAVIGWIVVTLFTVL